MGRQDASFVRSDCGLHCLLCADCIGLARLESALKTPNSERRDEGNSMRKVLEVTEREQIVRALEQANWVISGDSGAAARLGMKRSTLQARMQKLGIQIRRTGAS
jgi:transcriptional regulator with GAF, ATPase, and Fis domain